MIACTSRAIVSSSPAALPRVEWKIYIYGDDKEQIFKIENHKKQNKQDTVLIINCI